MLEQIKSKNIADLLHYLLTNGPVTKSDLVRGISLGNSTVSDAINDLTNNKLVCAIGKEESIGGRRSTIYGIDKDYGCFVGVAFMDFGIDFAITDCHNNVKKYWKVSYDNNLPTIALLLDELKNASKEEKRILGIGIGLHGEIDYASQVVIKCERARWQYVHLKEIVERELLVLTTIDHYVNGAMFWESLLGMGKGKSNFIYYTSLAPHKAGIFLNNQICRGVHNMAGRIYETDTAEVLQAIRNSLDIEEIVIAADDVYYGEIQKEITQTKASEHDLARGMALTAESKWFYRALAKKGGKGMT